MAALSSIQNRVDTIKTSINLGTYFYELNQLRLEYDINSSPYLTLISNAAFDLHIKAEKFKNHEIYYQAFQNGHGRNGYIKVFIATLDYFTAISNLNQFLKNNEIDSEIKSTVLKEIVKQYYESLRVFAEQFTALRIEYYQSLSRLSQSSG